jgi:uncharacterized membrane protein YbaN (DUF454 family)
MRHFWTALGLINVALGIIGAFLPVMPTTIFLIIAAWCFAKGSPRLHNWLMSHPRLGPPLRKWQDHGAIPRRAKILAVTMMAASFAITAFVGVPTWVLGIVAATLATVAAFILTRPNN